MIGYNPRKKKIKTAKQNIINRYAKTYNEIAYSDISEEEKAKAFSDILQSTKEKIKNIDTLMRIPEDFEDGKEVNEEVITVLASLYGKQVKIKDEEEIQSEIDTTEFEEELKIYFREHYEDIQDEGLNTFLLEFEDHSEYAHRQGKLVDIATKHGIEPNKINYFGYKLTINDDLIAKEDSSFGEIYYATPKGINNRINNLYSKALYEQHANNGQTHHVIKDLKKMKNVYIEYAKANSIDIENKDALETMEVNQEKGGATETPRQGLIKTERRSLRELEYEIAELKKIEQEAKKQYEKQVINLNEKFEEEIK